ncbi:hypothetical protein PLICRDRAFT_241902 [Plicaturopsis crispa FD-325 SS-3]|nr:hypothetical protein PLICRDRAFT_241902 [Plicaturopsis crispa FD-325 SS-3]
MVSDASAPPTRTVTPKPLPSISNPRTSLGGMQAASYSEQNFNSSNAPVLPQRFSHSPEPSTGPRLTPSNSDDIPKTSQYRSSLSPPTAHSANSSVTSLLSPFDDEYTSAPSSPTPSLPSRNHSNSNGNGHARRQSGTGSQHSRDASISSESDTGVVKHRPPPKPPRPAVNIPPKLPQRQSTSSSNNTSDGSSSATPNPPPLPVRRGNGPATPDKHVRSPPLPRLPVRHQTAPSMGEGPPPASPLVLSPNRKPVGAHRLPPPPTRTIGLGDKLPPARRAISPSSEDESEEEDKSPGVDSLPDTSRTSRRPPTVSCFKYTESNIHVQSYSGHSAVLGSYVVVSSHHSIKAYNLNASNAPIWTIDTKDLGKKEAKITAIAFRPTQHEDKRGAFVWLGTKDGSIYEIDVRDGGLLSSRLGAHSQAVTHIFSRGQTMLTVDEAGKVLLFDPSHPGEDLQLSYCPPRTFRIAEKQESVHLFGGKLWTSTRTDMTGEGMAKTPIIRVYDPFSPGSVGRSILPTEHVGAVTSGAIVPSQPGLVYIGHEGGFISIWSTETEDGVPACVEVMKVSSSDVLSLEGVDQRLWAGGRQGMISAYDVAQRPWVVTNSWMAHDKLPVLRLMVDPYSIEKVGTLCVISVGRDEQLRFWDGLLGSDWIEQEMLNRERSYSTYREMNVLIVSWNVDAAKPDALSGDPANINFLQDVLGSVDSPDIISFGFQEVIDLESRKMAAKTVLLGGKHKSDEGKISEKVSSSYKRWYDRLTLAVRLAMPPEAPYTVVHTENLVGLFNCVFVKNTERISLKDVAISTIKRGMGGRYGNKGGIVARFVIDDSSICLVNCHLAAGQHHVRQRNADVAAFVEGKNVLPVTAAADDPVAFVGGGDGSMILDHEIVFVNGDMNYRIDQRRDAVVAAIKANELSSLLVHDQLLKEMKFNRGFRFHLFHEGPLTFAPTYKYDRRSDEFDTSEKRRVPAWCDRVLWRSSDPARVSLLDYRRWEPNISDHRPVSATFKITVKSVRHEVRAQVKAEVAALWFEHQRELLAAAHEYFVAQELI